MKCMSPPARLSRRLSPGNAVLRKSLVPKRFERVGQYLRQIRAGLTDPPSIARERRFRQVVERDDRHLEQELEPQVEVIREGADGRLFRSPVDRLPRRGDRHPGADHAFGRYAQTDQEAATAGFDLARAA